MASIHIQQDPTSWALLGRFGTRANVLHKGNECLSMVHHDMGLQQKWVIDASDKGVDA